MLRDHPTPVAAALGAEIERALDWLNRSALPIWLASGYDHKAGGFFERINLDGTPKRDDNRRARVQPRQVYCYAACGGDTRPPAWREAIDGGYAWFEKVYRRPDGFYGSLASPEGALVDDGFDLYNQAFALFAFAQIAASFPAQRDAMETRARELLAALKATHAHPQAGFEEAVPTKLPLCSNPHMHLLEASLAWESVAREADPWQALGNEIAGLAVRSFMDAGTGALREFFDHDWSAYPGEKGRIVEPGHQFEWAWLLLRWSESRKNAAARAAAVRLFEIGTVHGICPDRGVAFMALYDDFSVADPIARLWPQTEWLKAAILLAAMSEDQEREYYLGQALQALRAMQRFLATDVSGLWYDKMRPDGSFVEEPAPASSFYHIVCAILEADARMKKIGRL